MSELGGKVSAVIPTRSRPQMVLAAVKSALEQGEELLEVIVVVDGPDHETSAALGSVRDDRLRVIALEASLGGSEARNIGVRAARGEWIGFLDDDDLWLPGKLKRQLAAALLVDAEEPVMACAVVARSPVVDQIWPRHLYRAGDPVGEYLFCRQGWSYGMALLQTSTLLARRRLLLRVPFVRGLKKHQDWDWLLRASVEPGVRIEQLAEPLAVFHVGGDRLSVGRAPDWQFSLAWAGERRGLLGESAYTAFLATECAPQMELAGAPWHTRFQLMEALAGQGRVHDSWVAAAFLLMPGQLRRRVRKSLQGRGGLAPGTLVPRGRAPEMLGGVSAGL